VGADQELSNLSLIGIILGTLNKSSELIQFVADRPGHDSRYAINNSKLKSIGWYATRSLTLYIKELSKYQRY